uniref:LO7 n=1 Tax=Sand tiger adomavirus 1 TaxID=3238819 RepID=A0AB39ACB6_9VIRU
MDSGMTTSNETGYDNDLAAVGQENAVKHHGSAQLTDRLTVRDATGGNLTENCNKQGVTETTLNLNVARNESIVQGSLQFYVRATIGCSAGGIWQSENAGADNFVAIAAGNAIGSIALPPNICNMQFQHVDLRVGAQGSVNAFCPNTRSSMAGHGILAYMNNYVNQPESGGTVQEANLDDVEGHSYRESLQASRSEDALQGFERLYHQLNNVCNMLCDSEFTDDEIVTCFPTGLCLSLRLVTNDFRIRSTIHQTAASRWTILFEELKVMYTVARIPSHNIDRELPTARFATVDTGCNMMPLQAGQTMATVPITKTDMELVPQYFIIVYGHREAYNPVFMSTAQLSGIRDKLLTLRCTLNGDTTPDFMSTFLGHTVSLQELGSRRTMRQAWLCRMGRAFGRVGYRLRPPIENHMQQHTSTRLGCRCFAICTDPSMQLLREGCAGAQSGRLEARVTFEAAGQDECLWVFVWTKQNIVFEKQSDAYSSSPQWTLQESETRPAFTELYTDRTHCYPGYDVATDDTDV